MSNKNGQNFDERSFREGEKGFSLIEAIVAIFILTIGLIGTAAAITYALEFSAISRNVTKAKLVVVASIEEVESMRNSRRLDFKQFANAGSVDNTGAPNQFMGFSNGFKQVSNNPGNDGVNGTDDDLSVAPGADGNYGTADDVVDPNLARNGFLREIVITNLSATLKKVVVRVQYTGSGGKVGEITGVSYLNDEARISR
ncbi:MAG TPA: prepilin-type N-terminal cleavage/methylation domain-containing protein [Pyrinomonadaceae bacterium]|nr:prepilin-type N-terminal cleavage/methylation domain-containing protein [Pyrinomonadaceae bacterium]